MQLHCACALLALSRRAGAVVLMRRGLFPSAQSRTLYRASLRQNDGAFGARWHSMKDVANHAVWEPRFEF